MKLVIRRWFVVFVVRLPGLPPACFGFGRDADKLEARRIAEELAACLYSYITEVK